MLKKFKSSYIMQIVFNCLKEKIKLKIVKYNEAVKKRLNIGLINYKLFTGKYLIYETNGIGKEYNSYNDKLLFEGEYKNGERNGKGKEYNKYDILIYEGEYKNGERNGKGEEYNKYGILIYEGEYKNGERNGKGKEYNQDSSFIFERKYLNGKRWNGKGFDKNKNIVYKLKDGKGYVKEYNEEYNNYKINFL